MRCCYLHCIPHECVRGNHVHCKLNCDAKLSFADRAAAKDTYLKRTLPPKKTLRVSRYVCCYACFRLAYDGVHLSFSRKGTAFAVCPDCYNTLSNKSKLKYCSLVDLVVEKSMEYINQWIQVCREKEFLPQFGVNEVLARLNETIE